MVATSLAATAEAAAELAPIEFEGCALQLFPFLLLIGGKDRHNLLVRLGAEIADCCERIATAAVLAVALASDQLPDLAVTLLDCGGDFLLLLV